MVDELKSFYAGQWRHASGPEYTTHYPADGSVVAQLHAATVADVDEAVQAAEKARLDSPWARLKRHERAGMLYRMAAGIRERAEELAQLQRLDNGKPINETRALVASAAGTFQYFAAACETWEDQLTPQRGDFITMSVHEPLGVVGAITPWNSPIASEAQKIAPALAAGCAVVIKPAEITPRMALELARIGQQAGVPDGILSVLPGKGSLWGMRWCATPWSNALPSQGAPKWAWASNAWRLKSSCPRPWSWGANPRPSCVQMPIWTMRWLASCTASSAHRVNHASLAPGLLCTPRSTPHFANDCLRVCALCGWATRPMNAPKWVH
jgi:hypothetical protein